VPTRHADVLVHADEALERLIAGNRRFVEDRRRSRDGHGRRLALRDGQAPFAVVLTCSDSRVVPELIFDAAIGDLFVIRVAGNVAESHELGSIEYATVLLGTNLIVVMGHESCGAITAAIEGESTDLHIDELVEAIHPAVEVARTLPGDLLDNAIRVNARQVADRLATSPVVLSTLVAERGLRVVPAVYHFETGEVEWLDRD